MWKAAFTPSGRLPRFVDHYCTMAGKNIPIVFVLLMNFAITSTSASPEIASARISMKGMRVTVSFVTVGDAINITASLGCVSDCVTDGDDFIWSVTEYPMLYDRVDPCSPENVGATFTAGGGALNDTHGFLRGVALNDGPVVFVDPNLSIHGSNSIFGRTLLLENALSSERYCASILPAGEVRTAVATLSKPVSGTVTFRQVLPPTGTDETVTGIYVDLDVTASPQITKNLSWEVRGNSGITSHMTLEEQCEAIEDNRMYNLTAEHGHLLIGTVSDHRRYYFIDTRSLLVGEHSVLDASLVLSTPDGTTVACPKIIELLPRTVRSLINSKNISGSVSFSQRSPFDYTTIDVSLSNLRNILGGYHIHEYPIPLRFFEEDNLAGGDAVSGHFNPYKVTDFPDEAVGTEDQYEVGDISNKFGSLANKDTLSEEYIDWNMPIFGTNSIAGRSVVLHLAEDGSRYAYGQIGYPATSIKTVVVDLQAPITGSITIKQDAGDPLSETTVLVDIANIDGTRTEGHNWHVHVDKNGGDFLSENGRCSSNGGHYNPFNVDLENGYSGCSPTNPRRCELGDFSGKHGPIDAARVLHTAEGKYFFTDVQLPLTGPYSIDERSVVIHYPNRSDPRLACHDTFGVPTKRVETIHWSDTPISGTVLFEQEGVNDPTNISVALGGLSNMANGWHVHVLPVPYESDESVCSGTLGHFNPFNVVGSPPIGTLDQYEVGDLSGKFDTLEARASLDTEYMDETLRLRGPRSINGRSVVVHRDDEIGSRWSCATLREIIQPGAFLIESTAAFETDSFSGTFRFVQTHWGNGYLDDTSIFVDSASSDVSSWSILRTTDPADCAADSEVYNPFDIQNDSSRCSLSRLRQCIMGNLDGKHGSLPAGGSILTDTNLPLVGDVPIIGRVLRLVVGGEVLCSRILPTEEKGSSITMAFDSSVEFDPYYFRLAISSGVDDIEMWQVVVSDPVTSPHETIGGCQTITFWVIGSNPEELVEEIETAAEDLGDYKSAQCSGCDESSPSPCSANPLGASTRVHSLSFFILLSLIHSLL